MEKLTEKQQRILRALGKSGGTASGKELADMTGISLRSIQYEMQDLKARGAVSSSAQGYALTGSVSIGASSGNDNDDVQMILQRLLSSEAPVNLQDLSEELFMSESALRARLRKIQAMIMDQHLDLAIHGNEAAITGTELDKRRMIRRMIFSNVSSDTFNINQYCRFFEDVDIMVLKRIIEESLASAGYCIQTPCASSLLLGILIGLYRFYKGIHTPAEIRYDHDSSEFRIAQIICTRFQDHYDCSVTDNDVSYIAGLFQGQILETSASGQRSLLSPEFEEDIGKLLSSVLESYMISCDISPFLHNLCLHVFELIQRGSIDNYVQNSSHVSMRESCPFIYDVAVSFARNLEKSFHIAIPDDEIGFLAVHIGLIIGQNDTDDLTVSILLYSSSYHQISRRIQDRLEEIYGSQISIHSVDPASGSLDMQGHNYDLIVSTQHLDVIGRRVIEITPFYSVMDRSNLSTAISSCVHEKETRRNYQRLMSCFMPELFFRRTDIREKEDAIRFLSQKMIDFGTVNEGFTKSVLEREEISPTCFFNSFAIPHSIRMDANKTMFAVLINEDGILWNDSTIRLCMLIAIKREDIKTFSDTYNGAVKILMDSKCFSRLVSSRTLVDFISNFHVDEMH